MEFVTRRLVGCFANRRVLIPMIAFGLLLSVDFVSRVWVGGGHGSYREFRLPEIEPLAPSLTSVQAVDQLRLLVPINMGGSGAVEKELSLSGVMGSNIDPTAIFRVGSGAMQSGQFVRARQGEIVEGWKVLEVDRRSVTLIRADETKVLELFPRPAGVVSK